MASKPKLILTLGVLALVFPSPLGAASNGCPPGYTVSAAGTCKLTPKPKPPCPTGYTLEANGVCKPSPQPKTTQTSCPRGQTPDRQGNCPR